MSKEATKKPEETALRFTPDAQDSLQGFEGINSRTMAIPFIRIAQALTPNLKEKKPEYIPGLKMGDYYNTVTLKNYGKKISLIVLGFDHVYLEWLPNRGGFVDRHTPQEAERLANDKTFGKWKTSEGNLLQETYTYICLVSGEESSGPVVLSLTSTALKKAKAWNRQLTGTILKNSGKRAMPYYMVWDLTSEEEENDQGSWYTPTVHLSGFIDEAQYALTKAERAGINNYRIEYQQSEPEVNTDFDPAKLEA